MYHQTDPRSTLATATSGTTRHQLSTFGEPQLFLLHDTESSVRSVGGSSTWYVRTASFFIAYYEVAAGDRVELLAASADRLLVIPHDDESIVVEPAGGAPIPVDEATVQVVPGACAVSARTAATVIECAAYADLNEVPPALNDVAYLEPTPGLRALEPRRVPAFQDEVKTYPMSDYTPSPDRFGRMFVSSNVMVNLLETEDGPRDTARLSPHDHDDFEQCMITTRGSYVHHWRTPWTADLASWREDRHPHYESPGIAVIPPQVEHTANSLSDGLNQMIDFFGPPRRDFIEKGWILNAVDGDV